MHGERPFGIAHPTPGALVRASARAAGAGVVRPGARRFEEGRVTRRFRTLADSVPARYDEAFEELAKQHVLAVVFLLVNGCELMAAPAALAEVTLAAARVELPAEALAIRFRQRCFPLE